MNIKVRFAFWFTIFVSVVLFISSLIIYILYSNFRAKEFYSRLSKEGISTHELFFDKKINNTNLNVRELEKDNEFALINLGIIIFDSSKKKVYNYPDTFYQNIGQQKFKQAFLNKEVKLLENSKEACFQYFDESGYYVYVSALDKYGVRKLNNIKLILVGVLLGGIVLSAIVSFLFVRQAFKPLRELSNQMLSTKNIEQTEPIKASDANDEISLIAKSYNSMIEQLKKSFEHQKNFVSHASHELRTPLATMLSQTEAALTNSFSSEQLRSVLVSLKEDQQGMIELTNSLLLLSQYENELAKKEFDIIRIDDILINCIEDTKKIFYDAIFTLDFLNVPNEEDLYFMGNRTLIISAFRNLLKNGYQYSDNKKVATKVFANKTVIDIYFENTGEIIIEQQRDKLFIPFYRADNKNEQKGHGIGLAIVQRIVNVSNGTITYLTKGNSINCFHVQLRKQKAD